MLRFHEYPHADTEFDAHRKHWSGALNAKIDYDNLSQGAEAQKIFSRQMVHPNILEKMSEAFSSGDNSQDSAQSEGSEAKEEPKVVEVNIIILILLRKQHLTQNRLPTKLHQK